MKYVDYVYSILKADTEGLDSIYEDYIVKRVGKLGLEELKKAGLIETCGVLNCRRLYVLVSKDAKNT